MNKFAGARSYVKGLSEKATNFYRRHETATVIGSCGLAAAGIVLGVVALSERQDNSIANSLESRARAVIPGVEQVVPEGVMINYTPGSVHNAVVTREDGSTCDIQFTTAAGDGVVDSLFPNQAKILNFGTCRVDENS